MRIWQIFLLRLKVLLLVLILAIPMRVRAAYYDQRPDVLQLEAKDYSKSNNPALIPWFQSARGQMLFLAQILTFFPNHEYYFLARDIEYTYDMARVLFKNIPQVGKHLHLVPVSTALSEDEKVETYLREQGVTEKKLQGRTALFIDSCCEGSVPNNIIEAFKESNIPIRGFLIQTNYYPNSSLAEAMGAKGEEIEDLPHYTESGVRYAKGKDGKLRVHAVFAKELERKNSQKIMEQIRFDFDKEKTRNEFHEIVRLMQVVYSYFSADGIYPKSSAQQAVDASISLASKYQVPVSDFLEDIAAMSRKGYAKVATSAEINKFLKKHPQIQKSEEVGFTLTALKSKLSYGDFLQNYDGDHEELTRKILTLLLESSGESLEMSNTKFYELVTKWIDQIREDNYSYATESKTQKLYFELLMKYSSPLNVVQEIGDFVNREDLDIEKPFRRAIVRALVADGYSYHKGSVLEYLLNSSKSPLVGSTYLYKNILKNIIENLDQETLVKVLPAIFLSSQSMIFSGQDVQEILPLLMKYARKGIDKIPIIDRALIAAYFASPVVPKNSGDKTVRKFNEWLFSQREYFAENTLNLLVPPKVAKGIFDRNSKSFLSSIPRIENGVLNVGDIVQYFSGSPTVRGCQAVFYH